MEIVLCAIYRKIPIVCITCHYTLWRHLNWRHVLIQVALNPRLSGASSIRHFHYYPWTGLIKQSLQHFFVCVVIGVFQISFNFTLFQYHSTVAALNIFPRTFNQGCYQLRHLKIVEHRFMFVNSILKHMFVFSDPLLKLFRILLSSLTQTDFSNWGPWVAHFNDFNLKIPCSPSYTFGTDRICTV
jgi:hypothetical protein